MVMQCSSTGYTCMVLSFKRRRTRSQAERISDACCVAVHIHVHGWLAIAAEASLSSPLEHHLQTIPASIMLQMQKQVRVFHGTSINGQELVPAEMSIISFYLI